MIDYNIELATIWNLFNNENERELIKILLKQFKYLRSADIRRITQEIKDNVIENWKLESNNTYFVATSDNPEADGSQAFIQSLKSVFAPTPNWKERNFNNSMSSINEFDNNSNIVLLDDFIGSGKTANRRLSWVNKKLCESKKFNSKVYFVAIAGMKDGISKIDESTIEELFVPLQLDKGITDYFSGPKRVEMIKLMLSMEKKLAKKYNKKSLRDFRLGYAKSETLYSIEALSTPNNVFPIFWWAKLSDGSIWKTFFNRL